LLPHPEWLWGPLSSYPTGTKDSILGVKWLRHETDHLPPPSAEVKNAWSYTSTHPYVFIAWYLVKPTDNCTCTKVMDFNVLYTLSMYKSTVW